MDIFKLILYKLFSIQEKFLQYRLSGTLGVKNYSKRKRYYGNGYLVDFNSIAEEEKNNFEVEITNVLKEYNFEPKKILEYIQNQGTEVVFIKDASKILTTIKENEGFIFPLNGFKALYL